MESKILTPLWLEDIDGNRFIVCAPFIYQSNLLNGIIKVKTGTETDLASIPKIFRGFVPKSGKYNKAAVLHDSGYHGTLFTENDQRINLIKELCDKLFLEVMLISGVNHALAQFMYNSVREFGRKK